MQLPESDSRQPGRSRSALQYSLRSMLILMTAAAVGLSVFTAAPTWLIYLMLMLFAMAAPMVLTVVLIYGRGYTRTFCIGALFPAGVLLSAISPGLTFFGMRSFSGRIGLTFFGMRSFSGRIDLEERLVMLVFAFVACLVIGGFGLLAMGVRRMVEARQGRPAETAAPKDAPTHDVPGPAANVQEPAEPDSPFG